MRPMRFQSFRCRSLLVCLLVLGFADGFAALSMQLEPTTLHQGQTLQVTITLDDPDNQRMPDLSVLGKNFAVVGTQRTVNYSVINGQARSLNQWIILLEPQKTGKITLPSIQFGAEKTPTAVVTVDKASIASDVPLPEDTNSAEPGKAPVQLNTHISTNNPYMNQQVIYTVSVMNSRRLLDAEYTPPQVKDALVVTLGDPVRHQATRDGIPYVVESLKYAIYPQKSGALKITPPRFSALLFDTVPGKVQVQGKPITLQVKPIPQNARDKIRDWLPAERVALSEAYDKTATDIEQGAMLVRTVTLEVQGLPAQMLPHVSFDATNQPFSVYPDRPQEETHVKNGLLVSVVRFKVSYLFNQIGDVEIPAVRLGWFNVTTGKIEYAALPSHKMTVNAGTSVLNAPQSLTATKSLSEAADSKHSKYAVSEKAMPQSSVMNYSYWGWGCAVIFALLWVVTLIVWWRGGRVKNRPVSRRVVYGEIKRACDENNPLAAKESLLTWARLVWPEASILSLTDLEKQIQESALKHAIQQLTEQLYQNKPERWQGQLLWKAWKAYPSGSRHQKVQRNSTTEKLPPLRIS